MTFAEMNLNDAERKLVVAAQIGEVCNLQSKVEGENDPADGDAWGPERTIDADVIRRLCVGAYPGVTVDYRGVRLVGARITGSLRLAHAVINFPVLLDACHFDSPILMTGAEARTVSLAGSHFPALMAGGVVLSGALLMSGAVVGGWSVPKSGVMALQLDGARISSLVRLDEGFSATGMVSMLGTRIRYQLSCRKGRFSNDGAKVRAINADGLDVGGEVFLDDGFVANGGVWLRGARIGRQLSCSGGEFNATHDDALNFDGAVVGGDVFLTEGLTVHGEVSLKASTVGGNLACAGSKLLKPSGTALSMDGATVKGDGEGRL